MLIEKVAVFRSFDRIGLPRKYGCDFSFLYPDTIRCEPINPPVRTEI